MDTKLPRKFVEGIAFIIVHFRKMAHFFGDNNRIWGNIEF